MQAIVASNELILAEKKAASNQGARLAFLVILVISVVALIIGLGWGFMTALTITRSLNGIMGVADSIAAVILTQQLR